MSSANPNGLPHQYDRWQEVVTDLTSHRKMMRGQGGGPDEFTDGLIKIAREKRQEVIDDAVFVVGENAITARLQEINNIMVVLSAQRQTARAVKNEAEDVRLTIEIEALRSERNGIIEAIMIQVAVQNGSTSDIMDA